MLIYYYVPNLILISLFLGMSIGCVSAYATVRRWSLIGDIISHSSLPGIVYMFLFSESQNHLILVLGGAISALISVLFSFYIKKKTHLPKDSPLALILSLFFSLGIIGIAIIQKKSIAGQSMINNFIYGNIITFASGNIYTYMYICIFILLFFFYTINLQKYVGFDNSFMQIYYKYTYLYEFIVLLISILTIVIGLQSVGILLMGALIIAPGSFAKLFTNSYLNIILLSMIVTFISFLFGVGIGIYYSSIPTGPIIALIPVSLCILVYIFNKIKNAFLFKKNIQLKLKERK